MKYTLIILSAAVAINLASCKKDKVQTDPVPTVDSQAYMLSNVQDISFINNQSLAWEIPVEWKSGVPHKVSVYIGGLPANVKLSIDTITGLPSFKPEFTLTAKYALPGKYPISVYATSAELGTKKYDVNLTIKPALNCVADYVGAYPSTTSTRNDSTFGTYNASIGSPKAFTLSISCFCKAQYSGVTADINCDNGTFNIPQQKPFSSATVALIKGSGQLLEDNKVLLKYDYYDEYLHNWKSYVDTLQ